MQNYGWQGECMGLCRQLVLETIILKCSHSLHGSRVEQGNKFHICHKYDNRLRTYAKAYHFDYIGQKYSRALVQPVIGEITEGANEYF